MNIDRMDDVQVIAALTAKVEELRPYVNRIAEWPVDDAASTYAQMEQLAHLAATLNRAASVLTEEIKRSAELYAICERLGHS